MARKIGPKAADLIKSFEGLRLKAYPDPATGGDPWTVGYGHTGSDVRPGMTINREQADALFDRDIAKFEAAVEKAIGSAPTNAAQFGALVSFAYNVGAGNLNSSTLLRKHKAGDFKGAQAEFARWNRAAGKVMAGLTRRRKAEADLYGLYGL